MKKFKKLFAISFMLLTVMLFIQKSPFALIYPPGNAISQLNVTVIPEGFYNIGFNNLEIRDTAKAYLRDLSFPYAKIDSSSAVIDSSTFTGNFIFTNTSNGNYYLVIKHRNSIETWSASGVTILGDSVRSYNFTDSATKAFGNNMILVGSRYCIYGGDVNQDGYVDASDAALTENSAISFSFGYVNTDVTGDSFVDASDLAIIDNNTYNFVSVIRP
ncbi:MAG: dockerin type I domain-containing protein [bacterium]